MIDKKQPRMMPGQEPYTAEELAAASALISGVARIDELLSVEEKNELERQTTKRVRS